jgi:GTP 3',8-cyclase
MNGAGTAGPASGGYDRDVTPVLLDTLGRPLRDLRISVTDRCNFRCVYCMPKEVFGPDHPFLERSEILSFEEIARVSRVFAGLGVRKIRLTGGEPTLRRDLPDLVAMLAAIPGLAITLTTNGSALDSLARPLAAAGLRRLTVSLDSLDDEAFRAMNDVGFPVARVLAGIDAAAAAGLSPIKVNCVVKRGVNERGVLGMAKRFRGTGHIVRFIEYMDVGASNGWRMEDVVPAEAIVAAIDREFPLEPIPRDDPSETAERWRYKDGAGEIGVIASVTRAFCRGCTRARLSADGHLYTCLFATAGHDLKTPLRAGASDADLEAIIRKIWSARGDRYSEIRTQATTNVPRDGGARVEMSFIGG